MARPASRDRGPGTFPSPAQRSGAGRGAGGGRIPAAGPRIPVTERRENRAIEAVLFLVVALAVYFGADWILQRIEVSIGRRLEQRTIVFFILMLVLALTSFSAIRHYLSP